MSGRRKVVNGSKQSEFLDWLLVQAKHKRGNKDKAFVGSLMHRPFPVPFEEDIREMNMKRITVKVTYFLSCSTRSAIFLI
jgi:hypothetical protein